MTRSMRFAICTGALLAVLMTGMPAASAEAQTTGSFVGQRLAWSQLRSNFPTTAFWNRSDDARIGYLNDGASTPGVNRAVFRMNIDGLQGKQILDARLVILETWSWSCAPRPVQSWVTGGISSSTTWANQPAWLQLTDQRTVAHGNTVVCGSPPAYVEFSVTAAVQAAANAGQPEMNIGLRAGNEADASQWKRFRNDPVLQVLYQDVT